MLTLPTKAINQFVAPSTNNDLNVEQTDLVLYASETREQIILTTKTYIGNSKGRHVLLQKSPLKVNHEYMYNLTIPCCGNSECFDSSQQDLALILWIPNPSYL